MNSKKKLGVTDAQKYEKEMRKHIQKVLKPCFTDPATAGAMLIVHDGKQNNITALNLDPQTMYDMMLSVATKLVARLPPQHPTPGTIQ